jgi:type II secretion system protein G
MPKKKKTSLFPTFISFHQRLLQFEHCQLKKLGVRCFSRKKGKKLGFSLLEIMVVVAIIGILILLGLSNYTRSQARSRDAKRKNDLVQLANAFELYHLDYRAYPESDGGKILVGGTPLEWGEAFTEAGVVYMAETPDDPAGHDYFYESVAEGEGYRFYASLENQDDEDAKGYYNEVDCGGASCNYAVTSPNVPDPEPAESPMTPTPTLTPAPTLTPTPTPELVCNPTPTSQDCDLNADCIACYGEGYQCSFEKCQPDQCEPIAPNMSCTVDAECIECYGSSARCIAEQCGVPTGGFGCIDDFDCMMPGQVCIDGMCI